MPKPIIGAVAVGLCALIFLNTPAEAQTNDELTQIAETTAGAPDAAETAQPNEAPVVLKKTTAGYEKGFFLRADEGAFSLSIKGRLQTRLTYEHSEGADDVLAFSVPRARLKLSGKAFSDAVSYAFQADFGKGFLSLKDFYIDYALAEDGPKLRAGQFKRPFSRQQINSSGKLEFVDRAVTDKGFRAGRDIGVALHNGYEKSPTFEYIFGVFNGTGDKSHFKGDALVDPTTGEGSVSGGKFTNVPAQFFPAVALRLGYNHGKSQGYDETDFAGGPLRFAVGASAQADLNVAGKADAGIRAEVDYSLKIGGFAGTGAFYMASAQSGGQFSQQAMQAVGFHLQAGYLIAGKYQPSLRYALIAESGGGATTQELMAGLSLYIFKHSLKWQTDGGALIVDDGGASATTVLVRSQLQLSF